MMYIDCLGGRTRVVESVLQGHPDKVCDQICDAILDEYLELDEYATVAVECLGTGDTVFVGGEVHSRSPVDILEVVNDVYSNIGYEGRLKVIDKIQVQSEQLRSAVLEGAAGDQGAMYGYACQSDHNFLPSSVYNVNAISRAIDALRRQTKAYLPDGKVQLTVRDDEIETLVLSVQHPRSMAIDELRSLILEGAVAQVVDVDSIGKVYFNHNSNFHQGGFGNDTGLSGRKIVNDTYCSWAPHGGGSFSGKDPTKVDRSGAYMARFVAKNVVANGLARWCLVSVAYAFGLAVPVMLNVRTNRQGKDRQLLALIRDRFDFRPEAIIERLGLRKVRYRKTASYGHFSDPDYRWEQVITL